MSSRHIGTLERILPKEGQIGRTGFQKTEALFHDKTR